MAHSRETEITFDSVRDKNVMQLRKLNTSIFPVRYSDKYYTEAIAGGEFTKLAYFSDIYVGAIVCRVEEGAGKPTKCYILTLGVLAPYRRLGIGAKLLQHCLELCEKDPRNIEEVFLHVQINNEEALEFYKKYGFVISETLRDYYVRIEPRDCYVLTKYLKKVPT